MAMSERKVYLQRAIARSYILREWRVGMNGRHLGDRGVRR